MNEKYLFMSSFIAQIIIYILQQQSLNLKAGCRKVRNKDP